MKKSEYVEETSTEKLISTRNARLQPPLQIMSQATSLDLESC